MTVPSSEELALRRIQQWMEDHPESFLTFSGGKDSTVLLHLLKRVVDKPRIAFFDSGFLFHQTYEFVENIQKWWGVEVVYITTTPSPLEIFKDSGWWEPGKPKRELDMKRVLIDNFLEEAQRHFDSKYSVYGLRAEESEGRNILLRKTKGIVTRHANGEFRDSSLAPIWDWKTADVNSYIIANKIPLNTAYRRLRELGVPANKRRTGVVLGDGIHLGDWAVNYQVDPSLGKLLESHFPMLQGFR